MRRITMGSGSAALLAILLWVQPTEGQLPGASAAVLGTANNYTALARGFTSVGLNPAGLGMPGTPDFSLAFLPVRADQTLDPISLSDIANYDGRLLPASVKEDWLERISASGGETGALGAQVTGFSLNYRNFGLQLSAIGSANLSLNRDAAELLLYGNAGRTGAPGDFNLQGSRMEGFAVTTLGLSVGFPLDVDLVPGMAEAFALGVTLKRSWGHGLALGEDAGSLVTSDPLQVDGQFPVIHTDPDANGFFSAQTGLGVDLGAAWQGGPWSAAATIQNLFHTFEWDLDMMVYRPGEALFDEDVSESDFDERPASQAPDALKDRVADQTFKPAVTLGAAYRASRTLSLTADFRKRTGDGLATGPKTHVGVGLEYSPVPFLPLWAGVASVTDGFQLGGGIGLGLGPVHLGFAGLYEGGDEKEGMAGMFTLSFGGR